MGSRLGRMGNYGISVVVAHVFLYSAYIPALMMYMNVVGPIQTQTA